MKYILMSLMVVACFAVPGKEVGKEVFTGIPMVDIKSLDLKRCVKHSRIEKGIDPFVKRQMAEISRHKDMYECDEHVVVIVTGNLHRAPFMHALRLGFFEGIAKITALVIDHKRACRGYIMPKMEWAGFRCEDGVFSIAKRQGEKYRDFFTRMVERTQATGFATPHFVPECVGVDPSDGKLYLLDLEKVFECRSMNEARCMRLPSDYKDVIQKFRSSDM